MSGTAPPSAPPGTPGQSIRAAPGTTGFRRPAALQRLASEEFDVLVVGGGVTGAGVALDAASRGLRTALVEKGDFASGTSSRSSKMVHGGIRYLQQREFRLVYENLVERQRLLDNAPHLVTRLPFLIPLFGRNGVVSRTVARSYNSALWLYDLTGGIRIGSRHRRVSRREALAHLPTLRTEQLVAGFLYFDARADDARLTLSLLRTAVLDYGAAAANYAPVVGLVAGEDGLVQGARVSPAVRPGGGGSFGEADGGPDFDVRAAVVVNATGVWADEVRALDEAVDHHGIRPAKGVHVTVPASRLPCDIAAVIPVPADRRSIFVVPWPEAGLVYVGTTDTDYDGPLEDPHCTPEDVDYLLDAVNAATTSALTRDDVTGVWAGLRPLLATAGHGHRAERTADLSRRHTVRTSPRGMVTVTGGKLTTYRKMAEDAMAAVTTRLPAGRDAGRCVTKKLRLRGAPGPGSPTGGPTEGISDGMAATGWSVLAHLRARYGTEVGTVLALAEGRPELLEPLVEGLPYLGIEVVHAARSEMAMSLDDVLTRRTRARLLDARRSAEAAVVAGELMAPELDWSETQVAEQVARFSQAALGDLAAAGVPAGPVAPGTKGPRGDGAAP
ncbi:MAG TPA: glycerol-3-phosphate dehydrogenase/oxidase [Acidimicrobiales bacterium]|nr:glycerol-3-phosphate dehydrogenase/oxidase [Acidimicrobiales bacterium]